jgi:hypothetical protein
MTFPSPVTEEARIQVRVRADIAKLVPAFLDNRRREVAAIPAALRSREYGRIRGWSRSMADTAGAYGFPTIAEIGRAMESAAKVADGVTIKAWADKLASYLSTVEVVCDERATPLPMS